jgi:putative intracellular protease/amidase
MYKLFTIICTIAMAIVFSSANASTASNTTTIKPVLIVMTSQNISVSTGKPTGFYLAEVTHPLAVFEAANIPVEFASIKGGEAPVDAIDLDDTTNARYWNMPSFREAIKNTQALSTVDASKYSAIFYAGGHGTMWDFPDNKDVDRVTRQVYEQGGIVAAVCHGPAALVNVRLSDGSYLVTGKDVSAFTDEEEREADQETDVPFLLASKLKERGANHIGAANWQAKVITSERLVTGQNPASATGVAEAMLKLLK